MFDKKLLLICLLAFIFCNTVCAQFTVVNSATYYSKPFSRNDTLGQCYTKSEEPVEGKTIVIQGKTYLELPILICSHNMSKFGLDQQNRLIYNHMIEKNRRYDTVESYNLVQPENYQADSVRLSNHSAKPETITYYCPGTLGADGSAPSFKWTKKRKSRDCDSKNPEDCWIWCLVDESQKDKAIKSILIVKDTLQTKAYYLAYIEKESIYKESERRIICPEKISIKMINDIHERLVSLGYLEPLPKRRYDEVLRDALFRFQEDNELLTGYLDEETLSLLGLFK